MRGQNSEMNGEMEEDILEQASHSSTYIPSSTYPESRHDLSTTRLQSRPYPAVSPTLLLVSASLVLGLRKWRKPGSVV